MDFSLDAHALRVLGALMEKSLATPDYYPLSLAALVSACNQKSSRDPVMNLSEHDVSEALDRLAREHLVRETGSAGARVSKYGHRLDDELGLRYGFDRPRLAVLTLLMLRGPQTPGELRNRSTRLHAFRDVEAVEAVLEALASDSKGPYVQRLTREPGRRESRYAQLFSEAPEPAATDHRDDAVNAPASGSVSPPHATPAATPRDTDLQARINALEERVRRLEEDLAPLLGDDG
jgi:uncharacterized protein YceH (UPF0502 family)